MAKRKLKKRSPVCTAEVVEVHNPRHGSGGELLRFHLIRRRPYMVLGEYHTRAEAAAKRKDLCGMLRKTGGPFKRVIHSWTAFERAQAARERPYDPPGNRDAEHAMWVRQRSALLAERDPEFPRDAEDAELREVERMIRMMALRGC